MPTIPGSKNVKDLEDTFVKVWFQDEVGQVIPDKSEAAFHKNWTENASGEYSAPELFGADALRKIYPNHSLVMSQDFRLNVVAFPGAYALPLNDDHLVTNAVFIPLARRLGTVPGVLVDSVEFGSFKLAWDKYEFIVYIAKWVSGFGFKVQTFILHDGPAEPAREFLLSAGVWQNQLHDEIWVFNRGFWAKDHGLWMEIQKANWTDVILEEEFKKALQKDVYGFFDSEAVYKELAIPWKRGIIMYGPPGNGKTISLKTVMKTCDAKGFTPLYVKSFQSFMGEEAAMEIVFNHARQNSPCVVVLEDLDSLVNDRNRSFFLNQLDGLEGNDGLLVIGTTNHFDRLDPGLSTRPSRFDRKYLFDDPDRDARALYATYWQGKLKNNSAISYPDSLRDEVADLTDKFSFAYLKEAFVSSLVLLAGYDDADKPEFATVLKDTIKTLREQLNKSLKPGISWTRGSQLPTPPSWQSPSSDINRIASNPNVGRDAGVERRFAIPATGTPGAPAESQGGRFRDLLNSLSSGRTYNSSERIYTIPVPATTSGSSMSSSFPPARGDSALPGM